MPEERLNSGAYQTPRPYPHRLGDGAVPDRTGRLNNTLAAAVAAGFNKYGVGFFAGALAMRAGAEIPAVADEVR